MKNPQLIDSQLTNGMTLILTRSFYIPGDVDVHLNNGERANNEDGSNSTLLHSHRCAIYNNYDGREDEEYCGIIQSLPSKNGPSLGILRLPPLMLFKNPA